jgi:type I restriction enzyme R subunit
VVIELKRSTVSVSEGIRQNLDNQKPEFIEHFFPTVQFTMAGNDTQGLRYGTIQTPEKYYLKWKEDSNIQNPLDRAIVQMCGKSRLLDLVENFIIFDAGTKKVCRHNQFFGVKAAQRNIRNRQGGIIWHTQGSGKSMTMVWAARWIRKNVSDARVVAIVDRVELDDQLGSVFEGTGELIHRATSGADLIASLNAPSPWLICSLIHKVRSFSGGDDDYETFADQIKASLPANFDPKGNIFVFVDECHRTQGGKMHRILKEILPNATFIGFTGTPLLKKDKASSVEIFGDYIHTYKFDEAVADGVVVDLRYEARDIDQHVSSPEKVDMWFESKTSGLSPSAKAEVKRKWAKMQNVYSSHSRLRQIAIDIVLDVETRPRLKDGRGNAIIAVSSIEDACILYEILQELGLKGKCGISTSYAPRVSDIKGESTGEGMTMNEKQYEVYGKVLAEWFNTDVVSARGRVEEYERQVKKKFVEEPGQMKLLVVVQKHLTGFDAPSATYLYVDRNMQDHTLFQAICRVNRLDGEDKEYGYIIDYRNLFHNLAEAVGDYTGGAFADYDQADVAGLLKDSSVTAREKMEDTLEAVRAAVETVPNPKNTENYISTFCDTGNLTKAEVGKRVKARDNFYKKSSRALSAYAAVVTNDKKGGYTREQLETIRKEVNAYVTAANEIKLASGDHIDTKAYDFTMRQLFDNYVKANDSETLTTFDHRTLVDIFIDNPSAAIDLLPEGIKNNETTTAETIEGNVRRLIVDQKPKNPKYYQEMSKILEELVEERRREKVEYEEYMKKIAQLAEGVKQGSSKDSYPSIINTQGRQALYDQLGENENLTLNVDAIIRKEAQDGWKNNPLKKKRVKKAILEQYGDRLSTEKVEELLDVVVMHNEY